MPVTRSTDPKFGVQFAPLARVIHAGSITRVGRRLMFKDKEDVTLDAIGSVARWLLAHSPNKPYQLTTNRGERFTLTVSRESRKKVRGRTLSVSDT